MESNKHKHINTMNQKKEKYTTLIVFFIVMLIAMMGESVVNWILELIY